MNLKSRYNHVVPDERGTLNSASIFERTWDAAIELCRKGAVHGQTFAAQVVGGAASSATPVDGAVPVASAATMEELRWAVTDREGQIVFAPTPEEAAMLTAYAREHGLTNLCRVLFNLNEFSFVD